MHLRVEGWRFIPHSYALVNQFQLAALAGSPGLELSHRDLPFFRPHWRPVHGLLPAAVEAAVARVPPARSAADAVYRIAFPYDLSPAADAGRLLVFGTAEARQVTAGMLKGGAEVAAAAADSGAEIVTPSQWSARGFADAGVPADRVHVIPHGVDPNMFRPPSVDERRRLRARFGFGDTFVFLNTGAATYNKGLVPLFKAFAQVVKRQRHARLFIKGLDALYASRELLDKVRRGLSESELRAVKGRVRYLGGTMPVTEIAGLYQAADCYVSPYLAEGFNLPVLEAAACGTPVICTRGGPTDEFVDDDCALRVSSSLHREDHEGGTRYLLLCHLDDLSEQMGRVIVDAAWRALAAEAGPKRRETHAWTAIAARLRALLGLPDAG